MTSASASRQDEEATRELTVGEALKIATALHRDREHEEAERIYLRILEVAPDYPDALHFLGVLRNDQGRPEEGARLVERALEQIPDHPDAHNNLGNIYLQLEREDDAEREFHKVLELKREHPAALANLGRIYLKSERYDKAIAAFRLLVHFEPKFPYAWHNLGAALWRGSSDNEEAIACLYRALQAGGVDVTTYTLLSKILRLLDRREEAVALFRDWLKAVPNDPVARFLLAAHTGEQVPERASDAYVVAAFDHYAATFDKHLTEKLEYRAPQHLCTALQAVLGSPAAALDILDAGCGTGLCGALIKPHARRLAGVDLSPRMIEKARRHGYDELAVAELTAYLQAHPRDFDVVLSADTLCYFGALDAVAAAARTALRPGGWLAFTVERLETGQDFLLNPTGRYAHGRAYVERVLPQAGFSPPTLQAVVLRTEAHVPVHGYVVLARVAG